MSGHLPIQWLCWQPTPYNNLLFRALAADPRLDLTVHFIAPVLASHPWQSVTPKGFSSRYFEPTCRVDWRLVRLALANEKHLFVIAGWHNPTMQLVLSILSFRRRPFILWTDTPDTGKHRNRLKATARSHWLQGVFNRAFRVMGTGCTALAALHDMGCPREKLVNLPYLVDLDLFSPTYRCAEGFTRVYGSSGRLSYEKGYDLALEALAKTYSGDLDGFKYRIAGIGPEKPSLEEKAKQLGIDHRVEFLGWLEPDSLPEFYASVDVFLHPARYEPYGVAVLEAMASGTIVVGSDATGVVADRIRDGVNGFVHRSDSVGDLVSRIEQIHRDWDGMDQVRKAARISTEEWPVSRGVNQIASIAEQAIGESKGC